jgi:hypothetical protein
MAGQRRPAGERKRTPQQPLAWQHFLAEIDRFLPGS